ncbi:MAG: hypothetical protein EA409_00560 [Saprospirales bacterium]|nr:MAG: hypothetical protein EA409_00560 [Saprospirales bacterium]
MKKLFYLCIAILGTLLCLHTERINAQHVNQGAMMIGGGLYFTSIENENSSNTTSFSLLPGFAFFVANNFALGLELEYSRTKGTHSTLTSYGLGPIARGYMAGGLFGQVQYIWSEYKFEGSFGESKNSESAFRIGLGYTAFLNNSIALEPILFYSFEDEGNVFGFRIGVQAFLGR